jgi:acetoin:2,6-dichlorophenolindophenol oxidoreductase subunit beta
MPTDSQVETRKLTFAQAVNEGLHQAMEADESVICYGLGVTDPSGVFGTTTNLEEAFGWDRVFDIPTSENAMTGVAVGAAIGGLRPVMTHQRLDFFLLAMDQLVNSAAKWHYMFGGQFTVPITIRLVIGRGWGQGPTHSQSLHSWFTHIPGLKVVMPTTPADAKGLLLASIADPNPVLFLEHRWLHNIEDNVPVEDYQVPLGTANLVREGSDLTIVSSGYLTVEAIQAADYLQSIGIGTDVIDLRTLSPLDWRTLMESVEKTGRLLALDSAPLTGSLAEGLSGRVAKQAYKHLKSPPQVLAHADAPEPTSYGLNVGFHVRARDIARKAVELLGMQPRGLEDVLPIPNPHDVPGNWFQGPF